MSTVYQQDIIVARKMLDAYSEPEVINLFRFTPTQAQFINESTKPVTSWFKDINSGKGKGRPRVMTPRMVEAAASLYMFHNCPMKEIAKLYEVDDTTISKALGRYHGFEK